jgi:hypothetical protein
MCAVTMVLGVIALIHTEGRTTVYTRHRAGLITAGDFRGSTAGPDVPPDVLPLFPSTTTASVARTTSTANSTTAQSAFDPAMSPPAVGAYAYAIDGSESTTGFGSRKLPATMKLTTRRANGLAANEVVFDLNFSPNHHESEVVVFRADAVAVRRQATDVSFGPVKWTSDYQYRPVVARAALPFVSGAVRSGESDVRDGGGTVVRIEDWKVTDAAGWEVSFERTSRAGAAESLRETWRAWFDPSRRIWVKWETHRHIERRANGLPVAYDLDYVATFTGFTPAAA